MIDNESYSLILPGRIVEYYPETQTATVIVSAERVQNSSNETSKLVQRGTIEGVPVHTPSGGGWSITMPIAVGDTCLLLFSQVGYDHWFYNDTDTAGTLAELPKPWLSRQFNEDDGFAFVGINTLPRKISGYHSSHSQWRGPDPTKQVISLNDDETITVTSSTKVTINAPVVEVNCDNANINADTLCAIKSPATTISGTLEVTGAVTNLNTVSNTGIVTNLAAVNTTGVTTTGGIAVAGGAAANMGSGAVTSTGSITVNGISLETHTHTYNDNGTPSETSTGH